MQIWKPLYTLEEADVVLIGLHPVADKVRQHFNRTYTFDLERRQDLFDRKIHDIGNVKLTQLPAVLKKANPKARVIFIGDSHYITEQICKVVKPKSLLSLDAHLDMLDQGKMPGKVTYDKENAPVMRNIHEMGTRVMIRGARAAARDEYEYAQKSRISYMRQLNFKGRVDYLSIDVDVLDPAYIGTGAPEALGATPQELVEEIKRVDFKYADIVEWLPPQGAAVMVKILKELLFR